MRSDLSIDPRLLGRHYREVRARLARGPADAEVTVEHDPEPAGPPAQPVQVVTEAPAPAPRFLYARRPGTNEPTIALIVHEVRTFYGLTHAEIVGPRRIKRFVRPRQVAMFLARTMAQRSFPEIGRRFGGRDHTSALHGILTTEERILKDHELADEIEEIKRRITSAMESAA